MSERPITRPNLVWPIFDIIYDNARALDKDDSVLIGRFALVKYSDEAITHDRRSVIEQALANATIAKLEPIESVIAKITTDENEQQYLKNFYLDGKNISKDRTIYQKQAVELGDGNYIADYVEICYLNEAGVDLHEEVKRQFLAQISWDNTYLYPKEE